MSHPQRKSIKSLNFVIYLNEMSLIKSVEITKNVFMPIIGVGTWQITDKKVLHDVLDEAFACGYRLIDTAAVYGNEESIGEILKTLLPKHGLKREDVFITSKLSTGNHGAGNAGRAALQSLQRLQLTYLDLYLVHFPGSHGVESGNAEKLRELRKGTWADLEKLQREGKLRAVGVSNYMVHHLREMSTYATIQPAVNQCEYHPHNLYEDLVKYCKENGVHFQAYSSLGTRDSKEKLFSEPLVTQMSQKYHCDKAQLLYAWAMNQGISILPKTTNPSHVRSNFKACDLVLEPADVEKLKSLNSNSHYCWNPTNVS